MTLADNSNDDVSSVKAQSNAIIFKITDASADTINRNLSMTMIDAIALP